MFTFANKFLKYNRSLKPKMKSSSLFRRFHTTPASQPPTSQRPFKFNIIKTLSKDHFHCCICLNNHQRFSSRECNICKQKICRSCYITVKHNIEKSITSSFSNIRTNDNTSHFCPTCRTTIY